MADSDKNLRAYFDKILEIQKQQQSRELSEAELKEIALEMGLSEGDWQAVEKTFQDYYQRGEGFLKHKNWEDAIAELKQALTLKPSHVATQYQIAQAYEGLWKEQKKQEYKELAIQHARQCLQLKADHSGALKLISDLKRNPIKLASPSSANTRKIWLPAVVGLSLLFVAVTLVLFLSPRSSSSTVQVEVKKSAPIDPDDNSPAVDYTETEETGMDTNLNAIALPVTLVNDDKSKGLAYQPQTSIYTKYDKSYNCKVLGTIRVDGYEIDKLKMKVEFLDATQKPIFTDYVDVINNYSAAARNGDLIPFNYSDYKDTGSFPDFRSIRLSVSLIEREEMTAAYQASPSKTLVWPNAKPANMDLELRERLSSRNGKYQKLELAFKNTGTRSIKHLQVELQWFAPNGEMIKSAKLFVCTDSNPKIKPGQTRVKQGTWDISDKKGQLATSYQVSVMRLE